MNSAFGDWKKIFDRRQRGGERRYPVSDSPPRPGGRMTNPAPRMPITRRRSLSLQVSAWPSCSVDSPPLDLWISPTLALRVPTLPQGSIRPQGSSEHAIMTPRPWASWLLSQVLVEARVDELCICPPVLRPAPALLLAIPAFHPRLIRPAVVRLRTAPACLSAAPLWGCLRSEL